MQMSGHNFVWEKIHNLFRRCHPLKANIAENQMISINQKSTILTWILEIEIAYEGSFDLLKDVT